MKSVLLLFCVICVALENLSGQDAIGLSEITNYSKLTYAAAAQNWDVKQDANGIMYFANNEGLLTFDGSYWNIHHLPNQTVVRSLEVKGERIYVGAQNEIGFFAPDETGKLAYTSLKSLLPPSERSFPDVWNIVSFGNDIFFRATNKIMRLNGKKFEVYPDYDWRFMGVEQNRLLAQDHSNNILEFRNNRWIRTINQDGLPPNFLVTSINPFSKDTSLVTTLKNGVFFLSKNSMAPFRTADLDAISRKNIYTSMPLDRQHILLATSLGGCFIVDVKGTFVQKFSTQEGLQNNNVRHVFLDRNRNLWLGLDKGIDLIAYDNAVKQINPDRQNEGAGYTALVHDSRLYIGTTNGLYYTLLNNAKNLSLVKGSFLPVSNSQGQVWSLSEVNGELLMGHHEGSFIVRKNTTASLDHSTGFWNFFPLYKEPSSVVIGCNYHGVNFYEYVQGKFLNKNLNAHFESARIIALDSNIVWVAHPYKGIFKVTYSPGNSPLVQSYTPDKGLSSINHYLVYKIRNKIISPTETGYYEYNRVSDRFEPSVFFQNLFGKMAVNHLKEDRYGNIWFVAEKSLGVVDFSGSKPRIIYIPELKGKMVSGFEFIYPIDINNVLVGGERGFYHIDYDQYRKTNYQLEVLIRTIKSVNEPGNLIFGGYPSPRQKSGDLPYRLNSLHFEYASTLYGHQLNLEYSYFLKGFDKDWSAWSKKTEKDYTNLPHGTYTFQVKARNNPGNESTPARYSFVILPPWYKHPIAYVVYFALAFYLVYWLYKRQQRKFKEQQQKHEEEQTQLQYLHQLEIDRTEKEIVKLKNQNLEAEINFKNKELAGATMNLVQKGELLGKIKEELMRLLKNIGDEESTRNFRKVIKMVTEDEKFEQDWEHFSVHFDQVHGNFLLALKHKYPNISSSELKLCAYLRMNLSTKEMAQLMNISVRGVEVGRYRLRKKLHIPSDANLFDYLIECVKDVKVNEELKT
ncbi:transcriptional regulator [Segetibacter sp. 3557_3]|uniref:triple tyrosine motif-containing protein n=1 Tax=Segetibacter sp. 3557_3 TaxID=2547429 RepID=UPI001058F18B|nr:triple tyrosine motif-containing protein [Segetibacter sp. 3557_3]TDH26950.1 transcriptional regulator [Segetibacter sp. 3557_3]